MPVPASQLTKITHRTQYPAINPANPANSAAGKVVVISGGATGIGFATARSFATAGAATVVLLARRTEILQESAAKLRAECATAVRQTDVWTYLIDIRDTEKVNSIFEDIRQRLHRNTPAGAPSKDVDVLVTSAASFALDKSTLEYDSDTMRKDFETNVIGNMNLVRAFLAPEISAIPFVSPTGVVKATNEVDVTGREKVVIDITSMASYFLLPGSSLYGASKGAFTRMMRQLQFEVNQLEGTRIRVHSFNPGGVYTQAAEKAGFKEDDTTWDDESLPAGFAVWLATSVAEFLKGRLVLSAWDVEELIGMKERFEADPNFCCMTLKVVADGLCL